MKGWICYPLWGLDLEDDDPGFAKPIFNDATIVSRHYLQKHCPLAPDAAEVFSGGGIRGVLEAASFDNVGPALTKHLIDIPPTAFIAVRRKKPEDGFRYAESIRTLLTGSAVLTSGQTKGFALTPIPLHWAAMPSTLQLNSKGQLQVQYKIIASNFIHLTPIRVSHRALLESWETGRAVHGSWRIGKNDPLSKALVGDWKSLTALRKRVREAAIILARAMESTDETISTLFSVVSLEILFRGGTSSFAETEELATSAFAGPSGPAEVSRLFSNRHKVAHEATRPDVQTGHSQEVAAAWAPVLLAAMAAEELSSPEEFFDHLRGRVLARRTGDRLRQAGKPELADEVERAAMVLRKMQVERSK